MLRSFARHQTAIGPHCSRPFTNAATISVNPIGGPVEDDDAGALDVAAGPATCGARRAASGRVESAVHDGVLLQGSVGTSAGVFSALPQEPLSAAAEGGG